MILGAGLNRGLVNGCGEPCDCCCSPRVLHIEGYSVAETHEISLVGPTLLLEANCKCLQKNKYFSDINSPNHGKKDNDKLERSFHGRLILANDKAEYSLPSSDDGGAPFAYARRNKRINGKLLECNEMTCFNGGRCLPSTPGFK